MKKLLIDTQQKMKNRIDLLKKSSEKVGFSVSKFHMRTRYCNIAVSEMRLYKYSFVSVIL